MSAIEVNNIHSTSLVHTEIDGEIVPSTDESGMTICGCEDPGTGTKLSDVSEIVNVPSLVGLSNGPYFTAQEKIDIL